MSDYTDGRTIYWDEKTIPAVREMFLRLGFKEVDPKLSAFAFERDMGNGMLISHARAWWGHIPLSISQGDEEAIQVVDTADVALLERCVIATVKYMEFIAKGAWSD